MSYPLLASEDHEILGSEYCSGYTDVFGKWNTGFYCPQTGSTSAVFCCGTAVFKYCCTTRHPDSSDDENLGSLFLQAPILIGVTCGILTVIIVIIVASCFYCSCCFVYKKRQAHLSGGLYRLQGSSSTASGLVNMYSSASNHNSLVTTPLDVEWNLPLSSATTTATSLQHPPYYNNQIQNNNVYSSSNGCTPRPNPLPHPHPPLIANGLLSSHIQSQSHNANNSQNQNLYHSLCTLPRHQSPNQTLVQVSAAARFQSQSQSHYNHNIYQSHQGENGFIHSHTLQLQPHVRNHQQIQRQQRASFPLSTVSNAVAVALMQNSRTNNKPFYPTQNYRHHHNYHQTLPNIMRANQYQRVPNGSIPRSISNVNSRNSSACLDNSSSGNGGSDGGGGGSETPGNISASAVNDTTPAPTSTSTLSPLTTSFTNGPNITRKVINCTNRSATNEITNGSPPPPISPSTSFTHPTNSLGDDSNLFNSDESSSVNVEGCEEVLNMSSSEETKNQIITAPIVINTTI